jgi:hypothetical protein
MHGSLPFVEAERDLREVAGRMCARKGFEPDQWLNRIETADLLGVSAKTLAKWASLGSGPPYRSVFGRARYVAREAAMFLLTQQRDPSESGAAKAVQMRRARGDRIGRPAKPSRSSAAPRTETPIAAAAA